MSIEAVVNANIRANTFSMFDGTPDYSPLRRTSRFSKRLN